MVDKYSEMGLKVGLEVHQQLDTPNKLFCYCESKLVEGEPQTWFLRRLRPTQSELGQIDKAANFEFQKGKKIRYETNKTTSCLVEMDEEPPHPLNPKAIEIALTIALMLSATPVDELHVMRKTVIDGSNTTGFQRTCIIATDGKVNTKNKVIGIQQVSLEEDAARKTGQHQNTLHYRIDRLGIPLIEITTAPEIKSPQEAKDTANRIGEILRATRQVKRGIGSIRQDLNISISDGALVEIKGVQELGIISLVIEYETQRQGNLVKISKELKKKGVKQEEITNQFSDVAKIFKNTKCRLLRNALEKHQRVLAVNLPKFKGFLKRELLPQIRLGTEMADRARFWGQIGGIFHTDELPGYDITLEEVQALKKAVNAAECDTVVFAADTMENLNEALIAVVDRAKEAIQGVPKETRMAQPNGTTRYMRPRPGEARMYPETDIPPVRVTEESLSQLLSHLPEMPEKQLKRLQTEFALNSKLANQLIKSPCLNLFKKIIKKMNVSPTTVAVFLTETLRSLKREGIQLTKVSKEKIIEIFKGLETGEITKEALPKLFIWLSKNEKKNVDEAISSLGLEIIKRANLEKIITEKVEANKDIIKKKEAERLNQLMAIVMREVRGRADPMIVKEILIQKLRKNKKS